MSNRKRPRGRPSKYPPEFQPDAVAMVLDEGRAIAEVGRAIGVNEGTLGNFPATSPRRGKAQTGRAWAPRASRMARLNGWSYRRGIGCIQ
jgi:transposase-like protein